MKKKLPNISKFPNNKNISNNKDIYYSYMNDPKTEYNQENSNNNTKDITIDNLFETGNYIFNIPVVIKTKTSNIKSTIIGKVGDHVITSNGNTIKTKDIENISTI